MAGDGSEVAPSDRAEEHEQGQPATGLEKFLQELERRHVVRVASVYALVSWLSIQVADTTFENFGIPSWAFRFLVIMLLLGFPASLIITWTLEPTPGGLQRTRVARQKLTLESDSTQHQLKRRWFAIVVAAVVPTLIFGALALFFYLRADGAKLLEEAEHGTGWGQSIAVLPLVNMSDVAANAFFAAGVQEDIITNLYRINNLKVISRTSATRYLNSDLGLREIGAALGADYILEGSVRRIDNHVRITVQLIDALNDVHLWANNYDRELVDVFATQSAIAREISNSVHLAIQPESVGELQGMPTRSVKAYDLYLRARSIDRSEPITDDALVRQRKLLEAAIGEDPDFVEAWAVLNEVYDASIEAIRREGWFVPQGTDGQAVYTDFYERSVRALKKAVSLDPDNVETLIARASGVVGEEHLGSEAIADNSAIRRKMMDYTIEKFPDNATAWYVLAWWYYLNANDVDAAKPVFRKALRLDPLHARIVVGAWQFFQIAADEEMVAMLYARLAQISPEKGKDQSLGKVSIGMKLSALISELYGTADPSFVNSMADLLESQAFKALDPVIALDFASTVWELQNDLERLASLERHPILQPDYVIAADAKPEKIASYVNLHFKLLRQRDEANQQEKARETAEHITVLLENHPAPPNYQTDVIAIRAITSEAMGQTDQAWKMVNKLLTERSDIFNSYGILGYAALAVLDLDQAVELILAEVAVNPSWLGPDVMAAHHLSFRGIIVHPDMQAYYVAEKKWLDYLGERVPEYAKYRS
jgi:TolB-like protein